jgi:two-component system OmpR family response regulator
MYRVMLIEDDPRLAELVGEYLDSYEFAVELVTRGDIALERFCASRPDIVILDLMLPGLDGMIVCRRIRETSDVPILILTAREDAFDEVSGLEQGADDYVVKPVQPRILLARLRTLLRRQHGRANNDGNTLMFDSLSISRKDRTVNWRGELVAMTGSEFKLLLMLADSAGQVLSRDDILRRLRGIEFDGLDRSIDNAISRLRRKFDDVGGERIKTIRGEGYLFSPSAWK